MGRIYRPVRISTKEKSEFTIAIIDTGADESVMSKELADRIAVKPTGQFIAVCASRNLIEGYYSKVTIEDLKSGQKADISVGVTDEPFDSDEFDEEGIDVIIGVDFLQKVNIDLNKLFL